MNFVLYAKIRRIKLTDENELDYDVNSWHYKVILLVFTNFHWAKPVPNNLCPYLRKLVISTLAYPFVLVWNKLPEKINEHTDLGRSLFIYFIIVHTVWGLIYLLSGGIYYERTWEDGNIINEVAKQLDWYWGTLFYLVSITIGGAVGGTIVLVCDYLDERKDRKYKERREKRMAGERPSRSLIRDYIRAKHNKICPRINFTEKSGKE